MKASDLESAVKFGEVLISRGKLTERQLLEALEQQREVKSQGGEPPLIWDVLVSLGFVSREDVARALARRGVGDVSLLADRRRGGPLAGAVLWEDGPNLVG